MTSNGSTGHRPTLAQDGHRPLPSNVSHKGHQPGPTAGGKVQGGYQAPGGGKPAAPTTGSGVKPSSGNK